MRWRIPGTPPTWSYNQSGSVAESLGLVDPENFKDLLPELLLPEFDPSTPLERTSNTVQRKSWRRAGCQHPVVSDLPVGNQVVVVICKSSGFSLGVAFGSSCGTSSAGCSPASDVSSVACGSPISDSSVAYSLAGDGCVITCCSCCSLFPSTSVSFIFLLTSSVGPSAFLLASYNVPSCSTLVLTGGPFSSGLAVACYPAVTCYPL